MGWGEEKPQENNGCQLTGAEFSPASNVRAPGLLKDALLRCRARKRLANAPCVCGTVHSALAPRSSPSREAPRPREGCQRALFPPNRSSPLISRGVAISQAASRSRKGLDRAAAKSSAGSSDCARDHANICPIGAFRSECSAIHGPGCRIK